MNEERYCIVGVGASAGGQEALKDFFSRIPNDIPAGFIVVTHLFRNYKSELTKIISRFTTLKVKRISGFMKVERGCVYVMPEDTIVVINNGILSLKPRPAGEIINKSIDIFFESLAEDQKSNAIGVILSGMGSDGSNGALRLFHHGGDVIVQDPASTRFNAMPHATIQKDHPDLILPPKELGTGLVEMIEQKLWAQERKQRAGS